MKIVCISDTHNHNESIVVPDGDVLVHAGDMTMGGRDGEVQSALHWIASLPHARKVIIAGNHDWLFQRQRARARELMPDSIDYLEDHSVVIDGVKFYGSPWQPAFGGWAFNLERDGHELGEKWAAIPNDTDVLITHGPPAGIGDLCPAMNGRGLVHVGDGLLAAELVRVRPRLHVFGHIHEGHGEHVADGTRYVNAAVCTAAYRATNPAIVVEI